PISASSSSHRVDPGGGSSPAGHTARACIRGRVPANIGGSDVRVVVPLRLHEWEAMQIGVGIALVGQTLLPGQVETLAVADEVTLEPEFTPPFLDDLVPDLLRV